MRRVREGTIGLLPAGALGVSFFHHLTAERGHDDGDVFFLERIGSQSTAALKQAGGFRLAGRKGIERVPPTVFHGDLLQAFEEKALPEVLLLCPNPDQLPPILDTVVRLFERMGERDELVDGFPFPALVLGSNGIYFQRLRQQFIERLEESTLLGRLPDLWPDLMPHIIGHLLRGVTIQTGLREGAGPEAIYRPGPRGITRLAGGEAKLRQRACELLRGRGGWFELAPYGSATRLEFDKAMVNLSTNLLGQFYGLEAGRFTPLRVREIVTAEHEREIRDLARHVFEVGRAVKAYGAGEKFEEVFANMLETTHQHDEHIPSSVQWLALRLRQGDLEPKLTPTEEWLLEPLIRYAHAAGLRETGDYFEKLKRRAIENLKAAASGE